MNLCMPVVVRARAAAQQQRATVWSTPLGGPTFSWTRSHKPDTVYYPRTHTHTHTGGFRFFSLA